MTYFRNFCYSPSHLQTFAFNKQYLTCYLPCQYIYISQLCWGTKFSHLHTVAYLPSIFAKLFGNGLLKCVAPFVINRPPIAYHLTRHKKTIREMPLFTSVNKVSKTLAKRACTIKNFVGCLLSKNQ